MVTKKSKLYPAVKICQSMLDYYKPIYLDHITQSEYDFVQLYELKKMTSEESCRFHNYMISFYTSLYDSSLRLCRFFYDERALKIDHATLFYLSIIDNLFDLYFDFSYSITDIFNYINLDFIYLGIPFYDCILDTCKEKEYFKLK